MVLSLPEREERIKLSVGVSPVLIFCVLLGARVLTKDTLTIIQVRYKYDQSFGLDSMKFKPCLDSMKYEKNVDMDLQQGSAMGVTGTPAFFIGTGGNFRLIEGAQPFTSFKQMIDGIL